MSNGGKFQRTRFMIVLHNYQLNFDQMQDYVLLLLARWMFGISDLADRNFLVRGSHVFSVDEEYLDHKVNFVNELKGKKCAAIVQWLTEHHVLVFKVVSGWRVPPELESKKQVLLSKSDCLALFS